MRPILFVFTLLLFGSVGNVRAGIDCIEAIFFDLGNTLVEDPGSGTFVVRDGAAEAVDDLQLLGVRLGVITNVPAGWDIDDLRAILAEPEFLDEFEVVILSSEAPAPKPDPAIYTFAHGALAAPRPEITSTAFVGETLSEIANSESNPTSGARSVGMMGIHLSDAPPSPLTDFTIPTDGLDQIATIVDQTCNAVDVGDGGDSGMLLPSVPVPNPSRRATRISLTIGEPQAVSVVVFDVAGRRVATLLDRFLSEGVHDVVWDGRTVGGHMASPGVYVWRARVGSRESVVRTVRLP